MSEERRHDDGEDFDENGPGVNGDAGSWFYVVGGIPMMIVFFVVLFAMVGSCDAQNTLIHG